MLDLCWRAPTMGWWPRPIRVVASVETGELAEAFIAEAFIAEAARSFCAAFFAHYNDVHCHAGIGLRTAASVHYGTATEIRDQRTPRRCPPGQIPTPATRGAQTPHHGRINEPTPKPLIKSA
jgi:putative transposase